MKAINVMALTMALGIFATGGDRVGGGYANDENAGGGVESGGFLDVNTNSKNCNLIAIDSDSVGTRGGFISDSGGSSGVGNGRV